MPRIRLSWDEANGDLPMVCAHCGRKAKVLVTREETETGTRHRFLFTVHRIANITLPRCEEHRYHRPLLKLFNLHVKWIEDDYVELVNAHPDFVDAVEDYRDRPRRRRRRRDEDDDDDRYDEPRPRRRPRQPESNSGWLVALLIVGAVCAAMLAPCLCLLPLVKVQNAPQQNQNQQPWGKPPGVGPGRPGWR